MLTKNGIDRKANTSDLPLVIVPKNRSVGIEEKSAPNI
jgi:hypothetical protein